MAKKKTRKSTTAPKNSNKEADKENNNKSMKGTFIALAILAIIVIALIVIFSDNTADKGKVVATINGEEVYEAELIAEFNRLPGELQLVVDENTVLSQLIDNKLLLAEAEKAGTEVEDEINKILVENNITMEELEETIKSQGYTFKEFEDSLKIYTFLEQNLFADITVSDEEVAKYYETNIQEFTLPESVKARHILVSTDNRTKEEAMVIMNEIVAALEADEDSFCDLVNEYSEDPGSIASCGEYPAFTMDSSFVEPYKNAAFSNQVGESSIAETQFGYHLIETLEKTPATLLTLEEIEEQLKASLLFEKQKIVFADYIELLRSSSEIINCLETPEACEEVEEIVEEVEEVEEEVETGSLDNFATCLTESGAKMYGAYWCSHCNAQKEMFGDSVDKITYIECAEEDDARAQTAACAEAGISGYPTWIINGQEYPGKQSFETLAKLTGCSLV
ncbi:MAG: peptidylprolyl isomerase [archaeon]